MFLQTPTRSETGMASVDMVDLQGNIPSWYLGPADRDSSIQIVKENPLNSFAVRDGDDGRSLEVIVNQGDNVDASHIVINTDTPERYSFGPAVSSSLPNMIDYLREQRVIGEPVNGARLASFTSSSRV